MNQKAKVRIKRSHEGLFSNQPGLKLPDAPPHLIENSPLHLDARNPGIWKRDITQIIDALLQLSDLNLIRMKRQLQVLLQKFSDFIFKQSKMARIVVGNYKVISIANVILDLQRMFYKLVKLIEINIRKKLRGEVSYGRPFNIESIAFFGSETLNDDFYQIQKVMIFDSPADYLKKNFVVDARKEMPDVAFQHEASPVGLIELPRIYFKALHALMRPFPFPARIGIGHKGRFKDGIEYVKDSVMDDPVPDGCLMDMSQLGVADVEVGILAMPVFFVQQIAVKLKNIILQMPLKNLDIGFSPLALFELIPCFEDILGRDDPRK